MLSSPTTTPFSPIPFSPLEKPLSLSEFQLHDAVTMLKSIKATFDTVDKRDVSLQFYSLVSLQLIKSQSTRNGFDQLIQKVATYLYTFYEQKYRVCDSHLSLALTQLWIRYRDQVIRYVHFYVILLRIGSYFYLLQIIDWLRWRWKTSGSRRYVPEEIGLFQPSFQWHHKIKHLSQQSLHFHPCTFPGIFALKNSTNHILNSPRSVAWSWNFICLALTRFRRCHQNSCSVFLSYFHRHSTLPFSCSLWGYFHALLFFYVSYLSTFFTIFTILRAVMFLYNEFMAFSSYEYHDYSFSSNFFVLSFWTL